MHYELCIIIVCCLCYLSFFILNTNWHELNKIIHKFFDSNRQVSPPRGSWWGALTLSSQLQFSILLGELWGLQKNVVSLQPNVNFSKKNMNAIERQLHSMVRDGFRRTAKLCEVYSTAEPKHYATIFKMGMRMYATKVKSSRAMRVAARLAGTTIDDIVNDEFEGAVARWSY